jgi:hypothetical protein
MEIAYLLQNAESKKQYYAKVSKILFLPLCHLFYILDFINSNQVKINSIVFIKLRWFYS